MKDVQLSNVVATVSDEVDVLIDEIREICTNKKSDDVVCALWYVLLDAIMQSQECTPQQAITCLRSLAEAIATQNLSN